MTRDTLSCRSARIKSGVVSPHPLHLHLLLLTPLSVSPFLSPSDHQETAAAEHSDKFPSVSETPKEVQTAPEEEEEAEKEEGDGEKIKETTEEKSRGSN